MNNNDLISRAWALAEYDRQHKGPPGGARKIMGEAPAVDALPVVHARWTKKDDFDGYGLYECSICKFEFLGILPPEVHEIYEIYYCPRCGAKMDGGNNG